MAAEPKHKPSLKFQAEILKGAVLPEGWTAQRDADGVFSVNGPCPHCFGAAYGPAITQLDLAGSGDADLLYIDRPKQRTREIVAACSCGSEHGKSGATSCGREWVVRLRSESEQ